MHKRYSRYSLSGSNFRSHWLRAGGLRLVICASSSSPVHAGLDRLSCSSVPLSVAEAIEGKHIPVGIDNSKAPQPLLYERQLLYKRRTTPTELVEERIRVHAVDVRVRRGPFVTGVVWTGRHVGRDGLEHDTDPILANSGPEWAIVRTLEVELEAEALAVVGD